MQPPPTAQSAAPPPKSPQAPLFPLPAYLRFVPGGITYYYAAPNAPTEDEDPDDSPWHYLARYHPAASGPAGANSFSAAAARSRRDPQQPPHQHLRPESLVQAAKQADDELRKRQLALTPHPPRFLASLSVLAEAVFGRLTGCPPAMAKEWADIMVLQYLEEEINQDPGKPTLLSVNDAGQDEEDPVEMTEDSAKPKALKIIRETTPNALRRLLKQAEEQLQRQQAAATSTPTSPLLGLTTLRPRPCGYVFKRGDIAWNCRTCQTDATCVICDECFRNSRHEGHEVYFHRTTPGGCCDCGDAEAWKWTGCCDQHRPAQSPPTSATHPAAEDPLEAVRTAMAGLRDGTECLEQLPTALPASLAAALGVVIGAAVAALVDALDGAGAAADPVQWRIRWADEAVRIQRGFVHAEDTYARRPIGSSLTLPDLLQHDHPLPEGYRLELRLHNDDVHTFDEVIEALHDPRRRTNHSPDEDDPIQRSLVENRDNATDMTHHVDADGQVTVKSYTTLAAAMQGFRRLKSRGLHCAVVSTAQTLAEARARALCTWLTEISAAHPAAAALVVHALVQIQADQALAQTAVWLYPRMIPPWAGMDQGAPHRRFEAFPPHLPSSFLTREEAELLHGNALALDAASLVAWTGTDPDFYQQVPYRLPSPRYRKSPHALWGTLPGWYADPVAPEAKHPLLYRLAAAVAGATLDEKVVVQLANRLTEPVYVVDTDLRKQQEADQLTKSVFPHRLPGLHMISGFGTVRPAEVGPRRPPLPSPMDWRHLLATSSFRAPASPILLLLLLDPYPTKQFRTVLHALFLSLLTDSRFKARFAGALTVAYRPLSTLFCAGVGTEADTPLHFTVQIFTAGSIVRALGHGGATEKLLLSDQAPGDDFVEASLGVLVPPIAHIIVRCIHTNLLGATQEVTMILKNTCSGNDDENNDENSMRGNDNLLAALTYVAGEHPLLTALPAGPDDKFLESRSTRHKRLPHLLRDLEYVIETPGTAIRLLLPHRFPVYEGPVLSQRGEEVLTFPAVLTRMLRLSQGMDQQKRKISGGHVEYEQNRWLEAFGLSLNISGTRDALAESATSIGNGCLVPVSEDGSHFLAIREGMANMIASLLREVKLWLYGEGMLETGLPIPSGGPHGALDQGQLEALQRSTLHVSSAAEVLGGDVGSAGQSNTVALSCASGVKMSESQLVLLENALKVEATLLSQGAPGHVVASHSPSIGPVIGDWLRVPHSPLGGDAFSFHLPLHRTLAKCVLSLCSVVVPDAFKSANAAGWWKIPILDEEGKAPVDAFSIPQHPLVPLIKATLRAANCRVVWMSGPDCTPQEAQRRRSRARTVSANIAVAKIIHSLVDHPIRCIAASQQIERYLWAKNGASVAGMAMNYSSVPLCRSFRDLDLLLVQLSAAGMCSGLGARRVFALLMNRFSMDGYLTDPERKPQISAASATGSSSPFGSSAGIWVNPPRLQDQDHALILAESFFWTICVLVTELPPPPPTSPSDDSSLKQSIRRELLHALAAEPRSHSEAMTAASRGIARRDDSEGSSGSGGGASLFRDAFSAVLHEIGNQKVQVSSRAGSGPSAFELKAEFCDEYDPTFYHLRRQEHQHAMDVVARLRKNKWGDNKEAIETHCLPIVCAPPRAHPRFLASRLMLHLESLDAAIRRSLLFALTNGSWLPPSEPASRSDSVELNAGGTPDAVMSLSPNLSGDVPVIAINRRILHSQSSGASFAKKTSGDPEPDPFSKEVVASSSVSFLEVLQLLTLQAHTLEECASLHRNLPDLDDESKALSLGLSINSYLRRLVKVPDALLDVWALRPYPAGPLTSRGSGLNRGSILGLLIALYEHRPDHGSSSESESGEYLQGDQSQGGARALTTSGLKWLLRFVSCLVDGATSVSAAMKCATTGTPVRQAGKSNERWTIDAEVRSTLSGMLANLPDLWPKEREKSASPDKATAKSREAGKAAQERVIEMFKRKQREFIDANKAPMHLNDEKTFGLDGDTDLCIICRCDDADGENNGPLGYLGHVQRSRVAQMRSVVEAASKDVDGDNLARSFRVVGHMGCQLRETEAMDSKALSCLPKGSVVTILRDKVVEEYGILSRRVLVRHTATDPSGRHVQTEGWASIQSSQGYVILSPLISICHNNTRWGSTRPIIKQCGHAAHLKCVEAHTLSLHQRAAGDQPYDGRFAANIADGEFLCPLCKQLSNILIPRDGVLSSVHAKPMEIDEDGRLESVDAESESKERSLTSLLTRGRMGALATRRAEAVFSRAAHPDDSTDIGKTALEIFGAQLYNAVSVPWDRSQATRKRHQNWNSSILKWDFEDEQDDGNDDEYRQPHIRDILRLLRQQLIAWATIGHSAASSESGSRSVEESLKFGTFSKTSDPWQEYKAETRDNHPQVLELKRVLTAAAGLLDVLHGELCHKLGGRELTSDEVSVVSSCLADILEGRSWILSASSAQTRSVVGKVGIWSSLSALIASTPCHVARDGSIPPRCEARATAAAMWASKGLGSFGKEKGEPPAPLCIRQLFSSENSGNTVILPGWGTMSPFVVNRETMDQVRTPFRPGVACGYLYTPLLAWDLHILSGALFSCLLGNDIQSLPSSNEVMKIARVLMVGRMIQAISTPYGYDVPDDMDLEDEVCWTDSEAKSEGDALGSLIGHCAAMINTRSLVLPAAVQGHRSEHPPAALLAGVGRAILPFGRSLILMLRACWASVRERRQRNGIAAGDPSGFDQTLETFLVQSDLMTTDDGFVIMRALQGPLPSELVDSRGLWWTLVNRWIVSVIGMEMHHGSHGASVSSSAVLGPVHANPPVMAAAPASNQPPLTASSQPVAEEHDLDDIVDHDDDEEDDEIDDLEMDPEEQDRVQAQLGFFVNNHGVLLHEPGMDDSDEEIVEDVDMDEAEEIVGFAAEQLIGGVLGAPTLSGVETGEFSEDYSDSADDGADADREFAHVSRSPILYYQPSLLGVAGVGPGRNGAMFEYSSANTIMSDLSHNGLVHKKDVPTFILIRLPKSFVELYNLVNKVKGRDEGPGFDESEDASTAETAICLLTGLVIRSGSSRRTLSRSSRPPGACTLHARKTGSGVGIFFLVQKCTVLLMHNNKSAYSPSIYVDEHGEEDPGLRRGRPLFLNDARYRALELLWRQQGIPREVAQIRSTSDRVIRDNWY